MAKKPEPDTRTQAQKFKDAAKEAGVTDDEAAFERALKGVAKAPPPKDEKTEK